MATNRIALILLACACASPPPEDHMADASKAIVEVLRTLPTAREFRGIPPPASSLDAPSKLFVERNGPWFRWSLASGAAPGLVVWGPLFASRPLPIPPETAVSEDGTGAWFFLVPPFALELPIWQLAGRWTDSLALPPEVPGLPLHGQAFWPKWPDFGLPWLASGPVSWSP